MSHFSVDKWPEWGLSSKSWMEAQPAAPCYNDMSVLNDFPHFISLTRVLFLITFCTSSKGCRTDFCFSMTELSEPLTFIGVLFFCCFCFSTQNVTGKNQGQIFILWVCIKVTPDTRISQTIRDSCYLQSLGVMDRPAHALKCSLKMTAGLWKWSCTCLCMCVSV